MKSTAAVCVSCGRECGDPDSFERVWETALGREGICSQCLADAKLGRLVRKMPLSSSLDHDCNGWSFFRWGMFSNANANGKRPEEALERAMGEGK